jgi:hypothetical protein
VILEVSGAAPEHGTFPSGFKLLQRCLLYDNLVQLDGNLKTIVVVELLLSLSSYCCHGRANLKFPKSRHVHLRLRRSGRFAVR